MDLKTKFNQHDQAFLLFNNKIHEVKIEYIEILIDDAIYITYVLYSNPAGSQYRKRFNETELFKTKQELTDNLLKK